MIIRWIEQPVQREVSAYASQHGRRRTLWLLFLPIFSIVRWQ